MAYASRGELGTASAHSVLCSSKSPGLRWQAGAKSGTEFASVGHGVAGAGDCVHAAVIPHALNASMGASIRDRLIALALYRMVSAPAEAEDAHPQSHSNASPISLLERLYRLRLVSAGILWRAG
jgi:hypothetical protein